MDSSGPVLLLPGSAASPLSTPARPDHSDHTCPRVAATDYPPRTQEHRRMRTARPGGASPQPFAVIFAVPHRGSLLRRSAAAARRSWLDSHCRRLVESGRVFAWVGSYRAKTCPDSIVVDIGTPCRTG